MNKRKIGAQYEELAKEYLRKQGLQIVMQNFRCRQGEIDLVVMDGEYLVFVEVKYRSNRNAGDPEEAVDYRKQMRICRSAEYYLYRYHRFSSQAVRYDVIAICGDEIRWYKNAFDHIAYR